MKLSEINKLAKDNVVKLLKDNGFKREKMLYYIKDGGNGIFYIVSFQLNYGENLRVTIACHTKEMEVLQSDSNKFPKNFTGMVAAELSPEQSIEYGVFKLWKTRDEAEAVKVLSEIETLIEEKAFPFFEKMNHKSKLPEFYGDIFWKSDGPYVDIMKKIIENSES